MSVETHVCAAKIADIDGIMKLMSDVGISMNMDSVVRYFFKSESSLPYEGANGGLVVKNEKDIIVGYCGLTPCPVYIGARAVPAVQMGVLGLKPQYGVMMFELMDYVVGLSEKILVYANTANAKSNKLWTGYAGFQSGTAVNSKIQFSFNLLGLLFSTKFDCRSEFEELLNSDFFARYLSLNHDVASDRSSPRLRRIWSDAIEARRLAVVLIKAHGVIVGYAILHKRFMRGGMIRYALLDMLAINDNEEIIDQLIHKVKGFAWRHGGVMVEYVGGRKRFPWERQALSNTFIWRCGDATVSNAIGASRGNFGGPFDGDRAKV